MKGKKKKVTLGDIYKLLNTKRDDLEKMVFAPRLLSEVMFKGDYGYEKEKKDVFFMDGFAENIENRMIYGNIMITQESVSQLDNIIKKQQALESMLLYNPEILNKLLEIKAIKEVKEFYIKLSYFEPTDDISFSIKKYIKNAKRKIQSYNFVIEESCQYVYDLKISEKESMIRKVILTYTLRGNRGRDFFYHDDFMYYISCIWGEYLKQRATIMNKSRKKERIQLENLLKKINMVESGFQLENMLKKINMVESEWG